MVRVHFICRGNALRSVIAEAYLKSLKIPGVTTMSSGTVADVNRLKNKPILKTTTKLLRDKGLGEFTKATSEQLTQDRIDKSDVNICMNNAVYSEGSLRLTFPESTLIWDIVDAGEGNRVLNSEDEHTKYDELIYADIKRHIDEFSRLLI
jgi:protein-tyrosine-phosphatase